MCRKPLSSWLLGFFLGSLNQKMDVYYHQSLISRLARKIAADKVGVQSLINWGNLVHTYLILIWTCIPVQNCIKRKRNWMFFYFIKRCLCMVCRWEKWVWTLEWPGLWHASLCRHVNLLPLQYSGGGMGHAINAPVSVTIFVADSNGKSSIIGSNHLDGFTRITGYS